MIDDGARDEGIRQFLEASFELTEKLGRLSAPENCIKADEIWVLISSDQMKRVHPMTGISDDGKLKVWAYDSDGDSRSRIEIETIQGVVSQFLADEGGDNKEACNALRADLEAALALLEAEL